MHVIITTVLAVSSIISGLLWWKSSIVGRGLEETGDFYATMRAQSYWRGCAAMAAAIAAFSAAILTLLTL
jgi:hypothetical protein